LLSLNNISIQFGGRYLFDEVSFMIGPHDRMGLVGPNGAGKSTLLKIIAGLNESDSGSVDKANYVTVGYLPQDGVIASGKTLYHEVETAFEDIMFVQKELAEAEHQLSVLDATTEEYMDTLEVFGELQHKLEDLDAFRMKSKIEQVLMGLGFSVSDFDRQTEEFSGGWQMRIALSKLLLKEPSVLLLDEPTNHLDLESLQWLENYLDNYNGAIVLVSHDRAFLDSLTTKTVALRLAKVEIYSGNYSFYEKEVVIRKEQALGQFKNQQKQIKETQDFIERFRYKATKARQVQSRVKALEKVEIIEIEDEEEEIHFQFPQPQPSGVVVMELKKIFKSYGEKHVFEGLDYTIERGDRIAIVGVNGAGKSTFSRIVSGVEPFDTGERKLGYNVILSYFAQHQAEELDMSKEVLQIVEEVAEGAIRTKLRTILGSFLFRADDVFKPVKVLSGGEKSRLALAKMLLQPANFLIMDEPTNHLDMRSKKVLQEALQKYDGTYMIVSHDRAFLDPLVNKVLEFSPGRVRTFLGNLSEYLDKKKEENDARKSGNAEQKAKNKGGDSQQATPSAPQISDKEKKRLEAEERQRLFKILKPYKEKLEKNEKDIERYEKRKAEIELLMADPEFYKNGDEAKLVSHEYGELKLKLEYSYAMWEHIHEEMEEVSKAAS